MFTTWEFWAGFVFAFVASAVGVWIMDEIGMLD
jgi:hypothetical protein